MEQRIGNRVEALLGLKRKIVGIKFVFETAEFDQETAPRVKYKMAYCNMVRLASRGYGFKADAENFLCIGGSKALGLVKPDARAVSGRIYYGFGIYDSLGTARKVQKDVAFLDHEALGVIVKPVEAFTSRPDVVLMLVNPYQGMRILQSYVYHQGMPKQLRMAANAGICSECTAVPYASQDLNVSLLCSNTRYAAKWQDDEMGLGMPCEIFEKVYDGMVQTVNPCETNEKKEEILARTEDAGLKAGIRMNATYYRTAGKP